jgi:hypothetical protein
MTNFQNTLPVLETMKLAWGKVKGTKLVFFGVFMLALLIGVVVVSAGALLAYVWPSAASGIIAQLLMMSFQLLTGLALLYLGINCAFGAEIRVGMISYVLNIGIFFRVVGFYILQYLIFCLPILLAGLIAAILVPLFKNNGLSSQACIFMGIIGGLVVGVYILYMVARLYIGRDLILMQGVGPIKAIGMSFQATKHNVLSILSIAVLNGFIVSLVFVLPALLLALLHLSPGMMVILIAILIYLPIVLFFVGWIMPYLYICSGMIYKTLIAPAPTVSVQDAIEPIN